VESDSDAFTALFTAHHNVLERFIYLRVSDRELAEDLANETFRIAWEKLGTGERLSPAWLFTTARNLIGNEYQRRVRHAKRMDALALAAAARPESWGLVARDTELRAALDQLDPQDSLLIQLTYWHGLSAREAADFFNTSPAAIWVRLTRARGRLRDLLDSPALPSVHLPHEPGAGHD